MSVKMVTWDQGSCTEKALSLEQHTGQLAGEASKSERPSRPGEEGPARPAVGLAGEGGSGDSL